jgi:hypothetical protein
MEKEIKFPTQYSYHKDLAKKEKGLISILKESSDLSGLARAKKGFEIMYDYFIEYPTSSLKDLDIYLKTKLNEDYSWPKELGAKEFIKEVYRLRENNFIFQNKENLDYLD